MKFTAVTAVLAVFVGVAMAGSPPPPAPPPPAPPVPQGNTETICDCGQAAAERRWLSARSAACCANEVREKRSAMPDFELEEFDEEEE
ncbi:hypothetical protein B0T11DRAFT_333546 [Plectosphaerella cucumerina]|uniref:Uncharacterized protein n=1 Tax=Plectosphaerella cucumerina TaxID=40658 RepID=A0A8K0WY99_9PEZI|nr:hypothetical protein B0T11DRAFT_333546 [Plectosphaerella cucumerina]